MGSCADDLRSWCADDACRVVVVVVVIVVVHTHHAVYLFCHDLRSDFGFILKLGECGTGPPCICPLLDVKIQKREVLAGFERGGVWEAWAVCCGGTGI